MTEGAAIIWTSAPRTLESEAADWPSSVATVLVATAGLGAVMVAVTVMLEPATLSVMSSTVMPSRMAARSTR